MKDRKREWDFEVENFYKSDLAPSGKSALICGRMGLMERINQIGHFKMINV